MKRSLVVAVMLSAFTLPAFAQRYTMFPDFAVGNGWITEIFFANQGLSAVPGIVVSFYDDNGAPVTINSNLGNSAALAVPTLNPGATQDVQITSASAPSGYAVIRYPSSGTTVTATEVFRYQPGGTVLADLAVPQQDGTNNYSFPVAINTSAGTYTNTGFAIANPTFDSNTPPVQTVVATLINSDGTIRQTITVPLPAGQHISKFVNELFPGLDNFIGSMSISSPLGVGVLADRQDGAAFGAVSTDTGPLLAPFAVSGTPTPISLSNTSPSAAYPISSPALVAGTVGLQGGYYYFRFTGNQGDIVSVMTDTQGLNSSLDSELYVTLSDGVTTIAYNDQNGLFYDPDSFVQVVLPASGTYYIVVHDYYGGGSSSYPYRLHFKLNPS